jgi:hypothetical protein
MNEGYLSVGRTASFFLLEPEPHYSLVSFIPVIIVICYHKPLFCHCFWNIIIRRTFVLNFANDIIIISELQIIHKKA